MKKLFTLLAAAAFALTLYSPASSACPGHDKKVVEEKEEKKDESTEDKKVADKKKDRAKDDKKSDKKDDGKAKKDDKPATRG
jgi:hypothetical protein